MADAPDYDAIERRLRENLPPPGALDELLATHDYGVLIESAVRQFNEGQLRFLLVQAVTRLKELTTDDPEEYRRWLSP